MRDYRRGLPPSAIDADLAALTKLGVAIHCRTRVDGATARPGSTR